MYNDINNEETKHILVHYWRPIRHFSHRNSQELLAEDGRRAHIAYVYAQETARKNDGREWKNSHNADEMRDSGEAFSSIDIFDDKQRCYPRTHVFIRFTCPPFDVSSHHWW
ncbi:hypothetical protein V9T40_011825 [Parthenolecanium corni]|uniref:Uncharacterized protein n=1 Tax=Parthenolecanium corni TaxID=536013 RepID=A0AAN9XYX5_9HEMI